MTIVVIGASQGTGALCVKSALTKGHSVSAFSRNPAKLDITHPELKKIAGDFHDAASVRGAVGGHDAVIISAAPKPSAIKETPDYFSRGTKYCIEAMKEYGVKRLVVMTAFGVGDREAVASWFMKRRSRANDAGERPRLRHRAPRATWSTHARRRSGWAKPFSSAGDTLEAPYTDALEGPEGSDNCRLLLD